LQVKSTNPTSGPRNSTLDVTVSGSGFSAGSRAEFALDEVPGPGVRTNATQFVSSTTLVANITISADADLALYDVIVTTTGGKKGIGTEMFEVTIEVTDLGSLGGSNSTEVQAINDAGQVVGASGGRAFLWENGVMQDLGVLPGMLYSWADDIDEAGRVVGYSSDGTSGIRAFIWTAGGGMQALPDLPGGCCSQAHGMNDAGQVVGTSRTAGGEPHAVRWDGGVITDLHTLAGGSSEAWKINELGQSVGWWWNGSYEENTVTESGSFTWTASAGMVLLGGGTGDRGAAIGINDAGDIVGWSEPSPGGELTAYLWRNGTRTFLGTLGGASSVGTAITEDGRIVGRADLGSRRCCLSEAFLWTASGGMVALGGPRDLYLRWAIDMNADGWIIVRAQGNAGTRGLLYRLP